MKRLIPIVVVDKLLKLTTSPIIQLDVRNRKGIRIRWIVLGMCVIAI